MRGAIQVGIRHKLGAGLLLLAAAAFGACEGGSPVAPPAPIPFTTAGSASGDSVPGDTIPGDTIPGDTIPVPPDTIPGDTIPPDTVPVPPDTIPVDTTHTIPLLVYVTSVGDSASQSVAGVTVTVSRGASNHVVATGTTNSSGALTLRLGRGVYTVRLAALPPGWRLGPGETGSASIRIEPGGNAVIHFTLTRT